MILINSKPLNLTKKMDLELKEKQQQKISENPFSLDSRDIAASELKTASPTKIAENQNRLEINILEETDTYQEVEVIYGDKKKRKRITKLLPKNFATFIYAALQKPTPSMKMGATNLANLSQGLRESGHLLLQEKFLRVLAKINQISEEKTAAKIWDSEERINTTEKAILLAVVNCTKPANEHLDRVIVSMRSNEILDQTSFKKFISEVVDLTKNPERLIQTLFGHSSQNLSAQQKANLAECLHNIVSEFEGSSQIHQIKALQKTTSERSGELASSV